MRGIVKVSVVGTLGLAVLFGSPAVGLAEPKAGANNCTQGPPQHLPPGSYCPEEYGSIRRQALTTQMAPAAWCCAAKVTPVGISRIV